MIKKAIIAVVVIVAAAAMVFAAGSPDQNNPASNSNPEVQQNTADNNVDNGTSSQSDEQTISAAEAKKIAEKYIEEPGASAGTPTLSKQDGKLVYTVPIIMNGENVGEIDIDAQTGENLGGAGGAP